MATSLDPNQQTDDGGMQHDTPAAADVPTTPPAVAETAPVEGEAKTKVALPLEMQQQIEMNRQRNMMQAAIRGTAWGQGISETVRRAIAEYCRVNDLDPQRHIEVLGGRIYLTATLYEERGAPLLLSGEVRKDPPQFINVDPRLTALADAGDEWAVAENTKRLRARIMHNAPEAAKATVVQRLWIRDVAEPIVGVNWCGGNTHMKKTRAGQEYNDDPVGEQEPTKTAETRAARRAWKQVAEAIPSFGNRLQEVHRGLDRANEVFAEDERGVAAVAAANRPRAIAATSSNGYGTVDLECRVPEPVPAAASAKDPFDK